MKVYCGRRTFDHENMTRGEAFVVVQEVIDGPSGARLGGARSLTHIPYHSPDGFEWGYLGSGPADLALAILADYFGESAEFVLVALRSMWAPRSKAAALHQSFKDRFVAVEQRDDWELHGTAIEDWLATPPIRMRLCELAKEDTELAEIRGLDMESERADADAPD